MQKVNWDGGPGDSLVSVKGHRFNTLSIPVDRLCTNMKALGSIPVKIVLYFLGFWVFFGGKM